MNPSVVFLLPRRAFVLLALFAGCVGAGRAAVADRAPFRDAVFVVDFAGQGDAAFLDRRGPAVSKPSTVAIDGTFIAGPKAFPTAWTPAMAVNYGLGQARELAGTGPLTWFVVFKFDGDGKTNAHLLTRWPEWKQRGEPVFSLKLAGNRVELWMQAGEEQVSAKSWKQLDPGAWYGAVGQFDPASHAIVVSVLSLDEGRVISTARQAVDAPALRNVSQPLVLGTGSTWIAERTKMSFACVAAWNRVLGGKEIEALAR